MLARQLLSIAVLPFTVTVLVPFWLMRPFDPASFGVPPSPAELALMAVGVALIGVGLLLFASSLHRFGSDGKGTLAPWDPPTQLVVSGPYRFVRNPMISGVILILFGEAAFLQTRVQLAWALIFLAGNAIMIPLVEEPQLRRKFGREYDEYSRNVGRLVPRLTPWKPDHRA